jgi:hypothetical protein
LRGKYTVSTSASGTGTTTSDGHTDYTEGRHGENSKRRRRTKGMRYDDNWIEKGMKGMVLPYLQVRSQALPLG